jgi:hypothetical protein
MAQGQLGLEVAAPARQHQRDGEVARAGKQIRRERLADALQCAATAGQGAQNPTIALNNKRTKKPPHVW